MKKNVFLVLIVMIFTRAALAMDTELPGAIPGAASDQPHSSANLADLRLQTLDEVMRTVTDAVNGTVLGGAPVRVPDGAPADTLNPEGTPNVRDNGWAERPHRLVRYPQGGTDTGSDQAVTDAGAIFVTDAFAGEGVRPPVAADQVARQATLEQDGGGRAGLLVCCCAVM